MWVSRFRPLTSPDGVEPAAVDRRHAHRLVHLEVSTGVDPDPVQADVVGRGAPAQSGQDLVAGDRRPSDVVTVTSPSGPRTTLVTVVPSRTSTPAARRPSATSFPANGSVRPSSRSARSSRVTCDPSPAYAWAISHATTPPPRTTSRSGTCSALVASMLVQGRASRRPSIGGTAAEVPVASTTACRATSTTGSPPAPRPRPDAPRPGARGRGPGRCPRRPASRLRAGVVPGAGPVVAPGQHLGDVHLAGPHAAHPVGRGRQVHRPQQRLGRDAGVEAALAARPAAAPRSRPTGRRGGPARRRSHRPARRR